MRVVRKATFKRLRHIREDLGLEVADIAAKLGGKPSIASIYRLEQGQAIRVAHARRVFDVVNVDGKLKAEKELVDET
jgi:transcriptional regulator with XRE-family HTH domain